MSTEHHTPIATGAAANAATFNSPLSELDAAINVIDNRSTALESEIDAINTSLTGTGVAGIAETTMAAATVIGLSTAAENFTAGQFISYVRTDGSLGKNQIISIDSGTDELTVANAVGGDGIDAGALITAISASEYMAAGGYNTFADRLAGIDTQPGAMRTAAALTAGGSTITLRTAPDIGADAGWIVILKYGLATEVHEIASISGATVTIAGALAGAHVADVAVRLLEDVQVNVRWFGAAGDNSADDTAAIQAAIDAVEDLGGGEVFFPRGIYKITDTLTWTQTSICVMAHKTYVRYVGTGIAMLFDGHQQTDGHVIHVQTTEAWKSGTDTTSIGVVLKNVQWSSFTIRGIHNFETGLQLLGDASGTVHNVIYPQRIIECKRGVRFTKINSGWANDNTFIGGVIKINSGSMVVGSRYVDMSSNGNGNTFVDVTMEGSKAEHTIEANTSNNVWLNCRFEEGVSILFGADSQRNAIIFGNNIYGREGAGAGIAITDNSTVGNNSVITSRGTVLFGDNGTVGHGSALDLVAVGSTSGTKLIRGYGTGDAKYFELEANGKMRFWDGAGYPTVTHPCIVIDGPNNKIYMSDGSVDPTTLAPIQGVATGLKIGNSGTDRLGLYGVAPAVQAAAIANVSGGATVDAEARTALNALLARLRTFGLLASS